jgi:hypothetical protein
MEAGLKVKGGNWRQFEGRGGRGGAGIYREEDGEVEEGGGGPWRPNFSPESTGVGEGIGEFVADWRSFCSIPRMRMERTTMRFFRCPRLGEGRPDAMAPWRGGDGGSPLVFVRFPHREKETRRGKEVAARGEEGRLGFCCSVDGD